MEDLFGASWFLSEHGGFALGSTFLLRAEETFRLLLERPEVGRPREFRVDRLQGLRSWPVRGFENWLVFYRPIESGIDVVRVLHGGRDLAPSLLDEGPGNEPGA